MARDTHSAQHVGKKKKLLLKLSRYRHYVKLGLGAILIIHYSATFPSAGHVTKTMTTGRKMQLNMDNEGGKHDAMESCIISK